MPVDLTIWQGRYGAFVARPVETEYYIYTDDVVRYDYNLHMNSLPILVSRLISLFLKV